MTKLMSALKPILSILLICIQSGNGISNTLTLPIFYRTTINTLTSYLDLLSQKNKDARNDNSTISVSHHSHPPFIIYLDLQPRRTKAIEPTMTEMMNRASRTITP